MSNQTLGLDSQLYNYPLSSAWREPEVLQQLPWQTASHPMDPMHIAPDIGQFMCDVNEEYTDIAQQYWQAPWAVGTK